MKVKKTSSKNLKVLHVMYQSVPNISGSSTRSTDILQSQIKAGIKPFVITSPFQKGVTTQYGYEEIQGVLFYRTYNFNKKNEVSETGNNFFNRIKKLLNILKFYFEIYKVAKEQKVDVIHSHAMFFCGIPSIYAAKKLRIPQIYEVRSLWEERKKNLNQKNIYIKFEYKILRFLETFTMKRSHHVIAINENLKLDLISRKIKPKKITIISNAVDMNFITIQKSKITQLKQDEFKLGYIGSISPIEGLNYLILAVQQINKDRKDQIKLLIFGNGKKSEISKLKNIIKDDQNISLEGSLDRSEIYKAYQRINIIVNPRKKSKLSDSVTPLKPLEAMGFEKIVLASDVGGMKELIQDRKTGFLFKSDNIDSLIEVIKEIISLSKIEVLKIQNNALEYINNERNWDTNAIKYKNIYENLLD